jgi:large subunit ribosomal protein L10
MKKTKDQKIALVKDLGEALKASASAVFVGFKTMNVHDETMMRRALRGESVKYTVIKKTLIRRALDTLGLTSADAEMPGEVALAYGGGEDATAAARLIHKFATEFKGKLTILGGVFEGKLMNQVAMQEIATIPSMQVLRGMFAQVINSPRQRFAVVLSKVAETKSA